MTFVSWKYCQAIVRVSVLLGILSIWGVSGLLAAPAGYYSMLLPISRWRTCEQCEHKPHTTMT